PVRRGATCSRVDVFGRNWGTCPATARRRVTGGCTMKLLTSAAIVAAATFVVGTTARAQVPNCKDLPATIYVDNNNMIVGGPDNGTAYTGTLNGTAGDDVIVGTAGADIILAGAGNDVVCGRGGNDTISGDDGDDSLFGEDGNDTISGGNGNDLIAG